MAKRKRSIQANPKNKQLHRSVNDDNDEDKLKDNEISKTITVEEIFDQIFTGGTVFPPSLFDDVISLYSTNPGEATLVLINLVIRSTGCPNKLSEEKFLSAHLDVDVVLEEIIDAHYCHDSFSGYPLAARGKQNKFRNQYAFFWKGMIESIQNSLLFDGYLIETLLTWLKIFSTSSARPFRHVATLTANHICHQLCHVTKSLHNDSQLLKGSERDQVRERLGVVQACIGDIIETILSLRYRDVFPDIRIICLESLSLWISACPHFLLDDNYLKYIGWSLNDRNAEVRLSAVTAARTLLSNEALVPGLQSFLHRFKDRFVELTLDRESSVGVSAFRMCEFLTTHNQLTKPVISQLYTLISESRPEIRSAASHYILVVAFPLLEKKARAEIRNLKGKKAITLEMAKIKALVEFTLEITLLPHMSHYFVDSLWDLTPLFQGWKAMIRLLSSTDLLEEERNVLAGFLRHSCHKIAGNSIVPSSRNPPNAPQSRRRLQTQEVQAKKMSEVFLPALPELLYKFRHDRTIAELLLEIIPVLDFKILSIRQWRKELCGEILDSIATIFKTNVDESILTACAQALFYLEQDNLFQSETRILVSQLFLDATDTSAFLREHLMRMKVLLASFNIFSLIDDNTLEDRLVKDFHTVLSNTNDNRSLDSTQLFSIFSFLFQHLLWKVSTFKKEHGEIKPISHLRHKLVTLILPFLQKDNEDNENAVFAEKLFCLFMDLLLLFSPVLKKKASLSGLAFSISQDLQEICITFFNRTISALHLAESESECTDDVVHSDSKKEEYIRRQTTLVECFCKVILYNAFPRNAFPFIVSRMPFLSPEGQECARLLIYKEREISPENEYLLLFESLKLSFEELQTDLDPFPCSANNSLNLSKCILQTYKAADISFDVVSSLHHIIQEGLHYLFSFSMERVPFFQVLTPFLQKIPSPQLESILSLLQTLVQSTDSSFDENNPDHVPYFTFVNVIKKKLE